MSLHVPKRMVAIKLLVSESEALDLHRIAVVEDRKVADMCRRFLLQGMYGMLGQAERRSQRRSGESSGLLVPELDRADFQESEFGDGGLL
jgi:hypothetical protein